MRKDKEDDESEQVESVISLETFSSQYRREGIERMGRWMDR